MKKRYWMAAFIAAWMLHAQAQHNCTDPSCTSCGPKPVVEAHNDHEGHDDPDHGQTGVSAPQVEVDEHAGHNHAIVVEVDEHAGHDHGAEEGVPDEHAGCDHGGGAEAEMTVSPEMAQKIGLKTAVAAGGEIFQSMTFPAEILLNRDQSAKVSPRFPSLIRQVFVEIGDEVRKGDVLASLENRETLAVYTVSAPLDGVVVRRDAAVGESADEERELFNVANLSSVWADISIFPRYQHLVKKGMAVQFLAHDGHAASGTVEYVSPLVSVETRTFTARCVLEGASEDFTPGAFVRARMITEKRAVPVRVEREAVQLIEGEPVVFIQDEHGFESRAVQVGMADEQFVEVTRGLLPGETYVCAGAFALKAEMLTSGMDPHAGHGH